MSERVFDDFTEFYSLTRPMTEEQRDILMQNLSLGERRHLTKARRVEGWDDLLIRNQIDLLLDQIKDEFDEDLIFIRIQVLSGHLRKVRKSFWAHVNDVFASYSMRHKWHILEGIVAKEYKDDWVLLVPTKRSDNE